MRSLSRTPDLLMTASNIASWLGLMNTDNSPGSLKSVSAANRLTEANRSSA